MVADSCPGYAVFDVETTGLYPSRHDRVIEIAIVHLDLSGNVTGEWCTLLNPVRDLGRQDIHGIRAADVLTAPAFEHVAGTAATMMAGRIPVAHNIAFDVMFLAAEYARLNAPVPLRADLGLCTMGLAPRFLQVTRRSLDTCCAAAGITMRHHHDALSDAHAAAALLSRYLMLAGDSPPWATLMSQVSQHPWPTLPTSDTPPVRRGHATSRSEHFLARIADQLPRVPDPPEADSYLAVLDQALIDRHISATEANQLVALARHLGLTRDIVAGLHQNYLQALATAAWEDDVVNQADFAETVRSIGMVKYDPLRDYLAGRAEQQDHVTMDFDEIEALVGPLPASALEHRAWWGNDSKVQAQAWRAAGWHVESVRQDAGRVVFARGKIGGSWLARRDAADPPADPVVPTPRPPTAPAIPIEDGMPEATAQSLLVAHLVGQGWHIQRVADTATREQGIDVLAARDDRILAVEVKGYPGKRYADPRRADQIKPTSPSVQARHWYAQAVLKAMLTRNDHPHYDVAIALPDTPTYRSLHQRTLGSLQLLGITMFLITGDGQVQEV